MESSGKKVWQAAFLIGIAGCMLGAILAYGFSTLAAIISGATLTIGIINALYGLLNRDDKSNNSLPAKIANTLNVNTFLKVATVGIWITAIALCIFGVRQTYVSYLRRVLEAQKVTIEGLVLNAAGDPADNAVVTLILSGRQEVVTAPGGKFSFPRVDLSNEPSKTVRVRASWQTHEAEIIADLTKVSPQGLTINLPAGAPPFRITYFVLEGNAIDFFLLNKMDAKWEEKLGGQPYIVPNEVSSSLSSLVKTYSDDFNEEAGVFSVENPSKKKDFTLEPSDNTPKKLFSGSSSGLSVSDEAAVIRSIADESQPWRALYNKKNKTSIIESLAFRKFLDHNDLNFCEDSQSKRFYQYITRDYLPPDFAYFTVYFWSNEGGCGDDEGPSPTYIATQIEGRSLKLRVAVIENVSKDPISLDSFNLNVNSEEKLRTLSDNKAKLDSVPIEKQDLFPKKLLSPGEKIVIPLEMVLGYDKPGDSEELEAVPMAERVRAKIATELEKINEVKFLEPDKPAPYTVSARKVENILSRPSQDFSLKNEYLYGPSVRIEGIEISKVTFPFRQYDSAKIIIRSGSLEGSCPYVYTYSAQSASWLNEGVILYGLNASHKETTDRKELARFDGRVLIKEKDPEESFIDAVYVKEIRSDGSKRILYPKNAILRSADHNYLRLGQGEDILIDFDLFRGSITSTYILDMVGYYVPHLNTSVSRGPLVSRRRRPSRFKADQ
jgi:hypothetical protein